MVKSSWGQIDLEYENNVLKLIPRADMSYELEDLIAFHKHVVELTEGKRFLTLSDFRDHHLNVSKETIQYSAKDKEINKPKIAEAVLVKSLPNLLMTKFYINVLKPITPTRIFRSEEKAREWLEKCGKGVLQEG